MKFRDLNKGVEKWPDCHMEYLKHWSKNHITSYSHKLQLTGTNVHRIIQLIKESYHKKMQNRESTRCTDPFRK